MSIIVYFTEKLKQDKENIYKKITIPFLSGHCIAENIWATKELKARALCKGLGKCGLCKVRFLQNAPEPKQQEIEKLSQEEIDLGIRLACQHLSQDNLELIIEEKKIENKLEKTILCDKILLAVDLGTSSVVFRAINKDTQQVIFEKKIANPQFSFGADVLNRLSSSKTHLVELNQLIVQAITDIVQIFQTKDLEICIAGNTIMTGILLNKNMDSLSFYPYLVEFTTGKNMQISSEVEAYIPPLISAFLGADISACLANYLDAKSSFILADLGTNAEIAYFDGTNYFATSVPLGPALEGMGLSCGSIYTEQVVSNFSLTPRGIVADCASATGISGAAYISLIHILKNLNILEENGHFNTENLNPLAKKLSSQIRENKFYITEDLYISATDIEEFLKVKAAFSLALEKLLEKADIKQVNFILTGAMGKYAPIESLIELGFIPKKMKDIQVIDNSVLDGAIKLLLDKNLQKKLENTCKKVQVIDLVNDENFLQNYIKNMNFKEI